MSEDELADAITAVWAQPQASADEPEAVPAEKLFGGKTGQSPFAAPARTPVPIRSGAPAQTPIDYDELTDAQFGELRRRLKRAAAEGKKIKL